MTHTDIHLSVPNTEVVIEQPCSPATRIVNLSCLMLATSMYEQFR